MLWALSRNVTESDVWHTHEVFELILCRTDGGRLQLAHQEVPFVANRAILVAPGANHRYHLAANEIADLKLLCLTPSDTATFLSPAIGAALQSVKHSGSAYADLGAASLRLGDLEHLIPDSFGGLDPAMQRLAWGAIALLVAAVCSDSKQMAERGVHRNRRRFEQIRDWIDTHLDEDLGLDSLAARFGISRALLSREFRRHAGQSVVEYSNFRRVEQSAQRLAMGCCTVAEAARACGFPNLSHYHRQFKSFYGLTPAAFQRMTMRADDA